MAPKVGSGERRRAGNELEGLWRDLRGTLGRLDQIAGRPDDELAVEDAPAELARLRYALHVAGERAYGFAGRADGGEAGYELADALAEARDATADVADAVDAAGPDGVRELLHEWRGALFRVRLARLRLDGLRPPPLPDPEPEPPLVGPLLSLLLTVTGASLFVLGATLPSWPLWVGGIAAVAAGLVVHRP